MGVRCVIFDVDGTLIDSHEAILAGLETMAETVLGRPVTASELSLAGGLPAPKALAAMGIEPSADNTALWIDGIIDAWGTVRVFPGVVDMLKELVDEGYRLGIVTAGTAFEFANGFATMGLLDYFDAVVTADDTERHKPDPEPLVLCASKIGARVDECVYVGDSDGDAVAADSAGMRFIRIGWGPKNASAAVSDPAEVLSNVIHG